MAFDPGSEPPPAVPLLEGRLLATGNHTIVEGQGVWFAYQTAAGRAVTATTVSGPDGGFAFELPADPLAKAVVGADDPGVEPIDLEPGGQALEPGDVVLVVQSSMPSHLRFGGA